MSGGRLVSLDRLGRDAKAYILKQGLATIGSDSVCDIRILLPTVGLHHATVTVHANQTVVRSVSAGDTLVNGTAVSVAALRHKDIITIGDRSFRWEYDDPNRPRPLEPKPALVRRPTRSRTRRRITMPATRTVIVPPHRDSMPSSSSGKQVAIVQPQRRTVNNDQNVSTSSNKRLRANRNDEEDSIEDADSSKRKSTGRNSPKVNLQDTTKATLWIESRKTPRKPTNLRLAALRKSQSDKSLRVTKIQAPQQIDHTKQAAIMLMTGHTPKSKQPTPKRPTFVITKPTPVRKSTNRSSQSPPKNVGRKSIGVTPKRTSTYSSRSSTGTSTGSTRSMTLQNSEINDSDTSTRRSASRRSVRHTLKSPDLPSPKKSALKDPSAKKSSNKTESIKFDLSNLNDGNRSSDVLLVTSAKSNNTNSDDLSLRYDESPSPRRSIHSRSSKILQKSLENSQSLFTKDSTLGQKSLTPEAYSIVDLVSVDTYESSSVYNSAGSSNASALTYNSPHTTARRKTRSNMLGSSTPYNNKTSQPVPSPNTSQSTIDSRITTRRSASMTTPENTHQNIAFNSTRISKIRSRSRINDSDVLLVDDDESPRSSRRNKSNMSSPMPKNISIIEDVDIANGYETPGNRRSPTEATTPVLNMQSLLDQSTFTHHSSTPRQSPFKTKRNSKRKTIGDISFVRGRKKPKLSVKSQSLNFSSRRSLRRKSFTHSDEDVSQNDEEVVTPTSAVKLVLEGVKNKHSTAKKTTSKRDIIDNLNNSDIIKQLFNSPVKRKLSRSMTEFSRKKLFEEDKVSVRSKRNTIAAITTTPDSSLINDTEAFTPEAFISPLSTPENSPNLSGIKRLFRKHTPDNDLRDVRGVKTLLGSPRTRRSLRNDLTDVAGVKQLFARSPTNRLSNVRVKEVFASSPNNDLRQVSGVKSLFRSTRQPKNTLEDVRGVKNLFINSPPNDLRNVSGVKKALHVNSPVNDLADVRGVKQLYREQEDRNNLSDVSGVEELFNESTEPSHLDSTFDQLMGKPRVRSYTKCKSWTKTTKHPKQAREAKSLQSSYSLITNNPEEWLENELKKRTKSNESIMPDKSVPKSNLTRELQRLTTNTLEGNTPLQASRARSSKKSASELYSARRLPIKKRSLMGIGDGSSRDGSGVSVSDRSRLPIKKRTLHSTPVKGMINTTINASMLRKVSPIAALDKTTYVTEIITQPPIESPKSNPSNIQNRTRRGFPDILNSVDLLQPIPKTKRNVREAQTTAVQEVQARVTRGRKTKETVVNAKKRRSSLVVPKKSPQFIPRSNMKEKMEAIDIHKSPVKTRTTRRKYAAEEKKPQTANAKSTRRKLPVEEKNLQPVDTKLARRKPPVEEKELQSLNKKSTRQKPSVEKIEPQAQVVGTRSTRRKPQPEEEEPQAAKAKSTRRNPRLSLVALKLKPKPGRNVAKSITIEVTEGRPPRARQTTLNATNNIDNQTKTRKTAQSKQKTAKQQTQEDCANEDMEPSNAGKRKRRLNIRSKTVEKTEELNKGSRGKVEKQKNIEVEEQLPNKRSRRKVAEDTETSRGTKTRARRNNNEPVKNTTRNAKKNVKFTETSASPSAPSRSKRGTKANDNDSQEQVESKKTVKTEEVAPARGRKAAATKTATAAAAAAEESTSKGRKRKTAKEESVTQDVAEVKKPRATRARTVAQTGNVEPSKPAGKEPTRRTRSRR